MKEKMKSNRRRIFGSLIVISLVISLSVNFLHLAAGADPELGISEGDSLVYQQKVKASAFGNTARETQYVKYAITNIPSSGNPLIITGDIYVSSSTSFGSPTETGVELAAVESFPKVGDLLTPKNSLFEDAPSEITGELYSRFLNDLESELAIKSFSIDSFNVLSGGSGYDVTFTIITENQTIPDSMFYNHYHELYMVIIMSMQGYYSSTGICLRLDMDLKLTAYSQEYIELNDGSMEWGGPDTQILYMETGLRIQPSLSTPEGVSERPWISTVEWILIVISGPSAIAVIVGIMKVKSKKKTSEKIENGLSPQ